MARRSWFFWFLFVGAAFFLFVFTSLYLVARSFRGTPPALGDGSAVAVDLAYEYDAHNILLVLGDGKRDHRVGIDRGKAGGALRGRICPRGRVRTWLLRPGTSGQCGRPRQDATGCGTT